MQNIPRANLPNISNHLMAQSRTFDIYFFKVLDCVPVV